MADSSFLRHLRAEAPHLLPWHSLPTSPVTAPHGTTVLALVFDGGVVMAGDRRATAGHLIAQRDLAKVRQADEYSVVAFAGTVGIAVELVRLFQVELEHYEKIEGVSLTLEGKANQLNSMVKANFGLARAGLVAIPLYAGYDLDRGIGRIFSYEVIGGRTEEHRYAAEGSGSLFAKGTLKKLYREDLTEAQAARAALEALYDAADDDTATGGPDLVRRIYPQLTVVTAEGFRAYSDEEAEALAQTVVAARAERPGGPSFL
ncbi:proteasome subunit beta [Crossiella equi]|uniref:proteasome subunit beta n=1 Tax=Crossiella equi TaxID=130796 RepID=UPI000A36DFAE|nr:proteasome subunit beta [Crossiella equi]